MRRFTPLVFLLCFLIPSLTHAAITGRVIDEENQPVSTARVMALANDSTLIDAADTDTKGFFSIDTDNATFLRVEAPGYNAITFPTDGKSDCGDIILQPTGTELDEFVLQNTKPSIRFEGATLVTQVEGTYLSKLKNADRLLGWIPLVEGENGSFSVLGKGSPLIYINKRLLRNMNELKEIQADNIKEVKVITNPGPKYPSSVSSVIIISTKRPHGEGFGVNINATGRFSDYFSDSENANITFRSGGLDLSLSFYRGRDKMKFNSRHTEYLYVQPEIIRESGHCAVNTSEVYDGNLMVNYQFNDRHSIGATFGLSGNKTDIWADGWRYDTRNGSLLDSIYYETITKNRLYPTWNGNLYYNGTIGNVEIDFDMSYFESRPNTHERNDETSYILDRTDNVITDATSSSRMWAQKLVGTYTIGNANIAAGEEYTNSRLLSDYACSNAGVGITNSVTHSDIVAAFTEYTQKIAERFTVQGGIRYEHTSHRYDNLLDDALDTRDRYNTWIPSLSVSANLNPVYLSLSYRRTSYRPSYRQLDEAIRYVYSREYQKGNPNLRSPINDSFDLIAHYMLPFGSISGFLTYRRSKNSISFNSDVLDPENGLILMTYTNLPVINSIFSQINMRIQAGSLQLTPYISVNKQWHSIICDGRKVSLSKPSWTAGLNAGIELPYGWWITPKFGYISGGHSGNIYSYHRFILNIGVYKSFFNERLEVSLYARDLFNGKDDKMIQYDNVIMNKCTEFMNMRAVSLTVGWKFNVPKNKYKGKGAGNAERNRL